MKLKIMGSENEYITSNKPNNVCGSFVGWWWLRVVGWFVCVGGGSLIMCIANSFIYNLNHEEVLYSRMRCRIDG